MSKKIKINDLTNPILSEFQKAAKDYGETLKIDLHSEAVINKACKNSGLQDFGDEDFISRLDVLMQSVSNFNDYLTKLLITFHSFMSINRFF